ncbi:MAG: sigma 54-interacting transcriptional regulator [Burkholderiaceae bacterium]
MAGRKVLCVMPPHSHGELVAHLESVNWEVMLAPDAGVARRILARNSVIVGLVVATAASESKCSALSLLVQDRSDLEWIGVFDAHSLELPGCRDLILGHLFDHHTLPLRPEHVAATLGHAFGRAQMRRAELHTREATPSDKNLIGQSAATQALLKQIRRVAAVDATVLINGESGTGKELTALTIHQRSSRAAQPFVAINCGAIQPQLIQSELFGHTKGSFTGASSDRVGVIEAAHGGTLFLDEIGDLPLDLQCNLLRVLQEGSIVRIGSVQPTQVDVRVIVATNINLEKAVAAGKFREDLFHRLNVLPIEVPPLRCRPEDIELLAQHYFDKFVRDKSARLTGFSRNAITAMTQHLWPGNVRELINRVRRAMVMADGRLIRAEDLGLITSRCDDAQADLLDVRIAAERNAILVSLRNSGNNVSQAARQLGVSRMTLYRLLAKHDISPTIHRPYAGPVD